MTTSDGQGGDQGADADKGAPQDQQQPGSGTAPEAPALTIIEAFGGIRPMAKTLGLAVSTVQGWKERAAIPANRHDQIRAAARDHNIALDADLLRASAGEGAGAQPQTIEGTAETSSAEKPADTAAGKSAHAPRSSAATAAAGARTAERAPAPARRGGAFLPGLVAGVVLAAAVAGATVYTRPYWAPLVDGSAESQDAGALAELETRLDQLESVIPADPSAELSATSERIATLEAALSQGAGQDPGTRDALESLSAELARLTDRLAALEDDVAEARSLAGTPSEEIVSRLGAEAQRLDAMLAQQTELAGRLAAAEADLNAAEAAREGAPGARETLLLLAALQLRDALQGSGPYAEPLAMLGDLADGDAELAPIVEPLERRASAGLPTLQDLQARFPEVARRIAAIEASQESDGWGAGVLRRLAEAVNLRPVGLVEGSAPTAVAARAEVKLNQGDLAGALAELDALDGAAAEAAAGWRADAEARVAAEQALNRLGALVSQ
ncbi:MAG TPA: mitofilin family membrane protein, partial [Kiloniellaceae bacterium]|nr:mitofilin family membrane protein [Kiloniellaceae bacterium]